MSGTWASLHGACRPTAGKNVCIFRWAVCKLVAAVVTARRGPTPVMFTLLSCIDSFHVSLWLEKTLFPSTRGSRMVSCSLCSARLSVSTTLIPARRPGRSVEDGFCFPARRSSRPPSSPALCSGAAGTDREIKRRKMSPDDRGSQRSVGLRAGYRDQGQCGGFKSAHGHFFTSWNMTPVSEEGRWDRWKKTHAECNTCCLSSNPTT